MNGQNSSLVDYAVPWDELPSYGREKFESFLLDVVINEDRISPEEKAVEARKVISEEYSNEQWRRHGESDSEFFLRTMTEVFYKINNYLLRE